MKKAFPTYFGGKEASGVFQTIINKIRPHSVFIEAFGGNYTVSRKLNNKAFKIVNDIAKNTFSQYPENVNNWAFTNYDYQTICDITLLNGKMIPNFKPCIYFDPPYLLESRKSQQLVYEHEMTVQDHEVFLDYATRLKNKADILISCYPNELYKDTLADWWMIEYQGHDRYSKTTEWLFMNYDPEKITELHDISYYGKDNTDRQRIKRMIENTLRKTQELDPIIQNFYVASVAQKFYNGSN